MSNTSPEDRIHDYVYNLVRTKVPKFTEDQIKQVTNASVLMLNLASNQNPLLREALDKGEIIPGSKVEKRIDAVVSQGIKDVKEGKEPFEKDTSISSNSVQPPVSDFSSRANTRTV